MQPGGGGDEPGCTPQDHPPATVRRDEGAPSHSTPPLHAIAPVASQEKKQRHEAVGEAMPPAGGGGDGHCYGCTVQDHPPATVRRNEVGPPHSMPPLPVISPVASQEKRQRHEHEHHPAASLPEGPLGEILARVPFRSLCRFRCVSKPWLALCSSRDILKRSPQTLSGFFYYDGGHPWFRNLPGRGPPLVDPYLPFLRESFWYINVDQVCGGLLLCICSKSCSGKIDYVVCNPATEEWTVLPPVLHSGQESGHVVRAYLGFDAAVPSQFVVFVPRRPPAGFGNDTEVAIYSSKTGQWTYVQSKWASATYMDLSISESHVFLNNTMHWPTFGNSIFTVDVEGKLWREIKMPNNFDTFSIGQSQGHLCAWQSRRDQIYFWVLEDYTSGKWTLRHTANVLEMFRRHCHKNDKDYEVIAVHPDCNVIFLNNKKTTLSFNLDNQEVNVICTESMHDMPYVPYFGELPSAGH